MVIALVSDCANACDEHTRAIKQISALIKLDVDFSIMFLSYSLFLEFSNYVSWDKRQVKQECSDCAVVFAHNVISFF